MRIIIIYKVLRLKWINPRVNYHEDDKHGAVLWRCRWSPIVVLKSPLYLGEGMASVCSLLSSCCCSPICKMWTIIASTSGTSLVAQWLRIRLPMQGTRVWALVREDPTCLGKTKHMCHNYWARVTQLLSPHLEPLLCSKRSHRNEKPVHHNGAPAHRN